MLARCARGLVGRKLVKRSIASKTVQRYARRASARALVKRMRAGILLIESAFRRHLAVLLRWRLWHKPLKRRCESYAANFIMMDACARQQLCQAWYFWRESYELGSPWFARSAAAKREGLRRRQHTNHGEFVACRS